MWKIKDSAKYDISGLLNLRNKIIIIKASTYPLKLGKDETNKEDIIAYGADKRIQDISQIMHGVFTKKYLHYQGFEYLS